MENIILTLIVMIISVLICLISRLSDEVKELKWYNKHYENMIRKYEEEKKQRYITDSKKCATAGTVTQKT